MPSEIPKTGTLGAIAALLGIGSSKPDSEKPISEGDKKFQRFLGGSAAFFGALLIVFGVMTGNPVALVAGIALVAKSRKRLFPEKLCEKPALANLRKELGIDGVEDETLTESVGKSLGFGKSAKVVKKRDEDLDKILRGDYEGLDSDLVQKIRERYSSDARKINETNNSQNSSLAPGQQQQVNNSRNPETTNKDEKNKKTWAERVGTVFGSAKGSSKNSTSIR